MERERRLREELNRQLQTAVRNAPAGFFLARHIADQGRGPTPPGPRPPGNTGNKDPVSIVLSEGAIQVNGNLPPMEMARKMVEGLRMIANSTVGNGGTLADALEMLS